MAEQKIWWGLMAEQKMVGALSHWVAGGTPRVSAKRSVEQKCGIKIGGTKIGGIKIWWGTLGYWVAGTPRVSAKRSAEQKCGIKIDGTKIGGIKIWLGDPRLLGGGDP